MNLGNRLNMAKRRIQAALKLKNSQPMPEWKVGELLAQKLGIPILPSEVQKYILQIGEDPVLLASWGPRLVMRKEQNEINEKKKRQSHQPKVPNKQKKKTWIPKEAYVSFYKSSEWQEVRYQALKKHGRRCLVCGRNPRDHGIAIHVDHIKPRSLFPELALDIDNLQVLCEDCNLGKSNRDSIDWR